MSIPYVIILSDSEDEFDQAPVTIMLSDSDNESYHSVPFSPQHVHAINNDEEEDSEEEPEEEDPSEYEANEEAEDEEDPTEEEPTENEDPSEHEEDEAIPETPFPSPEPTIPTTDPYFNPTVPAEEYEHYHTKNWTWLADTLKEWRTEEGFPTTTEVGESSTTGQEYPYTKEPPHHTVPLLVARMSSQELRIEHVENNVMEMPGSEMFEDLHDQVTNLEQHIEEVRDVTEDLRQRSKESAGKTVSLERRMDQLELSLEKLQVMAATMGDYAAFILRGDHVPKKD